MAVFESYKTSIGVELVIPEIVALEVLQGTRNKAEKDAAKRTLDHIVRYTAAKGFTKIVTPTLVMEAVDFYHQLRTKNPAITVSGSIDLLLLSWCAKRKAELLTRDTDFLGVNQHLPITLNLRPA